MSSDAAPVSLEDWESILRTEAAEVFQTFGFNPDDIESSPTAFQEFEQRVCCL
jgi:hypothetical protein